MKHRGLDIITGVTANIPGKSEYMPPAQRPHEAACWTLAIPGWMPTPLNKLMGHWAQRGRAKKADKQVIGDALLLHRIPTATRKRRVRVLVVLPKGKRACDPDALHKSLLDALVHHGALRNDSAEWCVPERVQFARGEELVTFITLEDL